MLELKGGHLSNAKKSPRGEAEKVPTLSNQAKEEEKKESAEDGRKQRFS